MAAPAAALADPPKLSAQHVASLQRLGGNKATSALLAARPAPKQPAPVQPPTAQPASVQRFPASALTSAVPWSQLTGNVFRPGEGISGGVYILTSNQQQPAIDKVVVKPVFGQTGIGTETAEQLQFGDRALSSLLGVATPASRIVHARTREYSDLVNVCRPQQPPPPSRTNPDEEVSWKDLSAAHALIVMSKVPDAKSAVSFAKDAATDEKARNDLYRIVFAKPFLDQLARISVGDLLLGNADRLVLGATNLGNIMISMSAKGDATLYAIDTTAVLPKATDTSKIINSGSTLGGGFNTVKSTMAKPEERLEGFYRILVEHMKSADKGGHAQGAAPWQLFENAYKEQKERIELDFLVSWRKALLDIRNAVTSRDGKEKMKGLTGAYKGSRGEEMLGYGALKANAMYLASRTSKADTHEESTADPAAYYAYSKLVGFDTSVFLPKPDELTPAVDVTMPGVVKTKKQSVTLPGYLRPNMAYSVGSAGQRSAFLDTVEEIRLSAAKYESALAALGTKKRGVFKRETLERNRVAIGKYVANVFRLAAGASRLRYHMAKVEDAAKDVLFTMGGNLKRAQVAKAVPDVVRALLPAYQKLTADSAAYLTKVSQAKGDTGSVGDRGPVYSGLADALQKVETALPRDTNSMKTAVRKDDKDFLVDAIRDYVQSH